MKSKAQIAVRATAIAWSHYQLKCQLCGALLVDDGFVLECSGNHTPALLITQYNARCFEPDARREGIARYEGWLPVASRVFEGGRTVAYRSKRLARSIGLTNLWIAYSGYWPERGAMLETATFKELEASVVLSRLPPDNRNALVVASAGNTAAAFARMCSARKIACLIIVPESGLKRLQFEEALDPAVKIVSIRKPADYCDAICLSERVSPLPGFVPEGGAKNVARRDGLGTAMLSAVEAIGRLPDYYFQAVGSGTGAIAAHEMSMRLIGDGRFGERPPRLMLSQNLPFAPLYISWRSRSDELVKITEEDGRKQIEQLAAKVLSNRRPPYAVKGGVLDVLRQSNGLMFAIDNLRVRQAGRLFRECEAIDIDPAGAVALASLIEAVMLNLVERNAVVMLHITGGGWVKRSEDKNLKEVSPDIEVNADDILSNRTLDDICGLFA
jgi:cysteate synthase